MRELKFRVWEIPSKKFYYDLDWLFKNPSVLPSKIFNRHDNLLIIEQWTGFKDEYGNDVYEGDIIEKQVYNHLFGKTSIIFEHGGFVESKYKYTLGYIAGPEYIHNKLKGFKVIGNIHEDDL